MKRELMRMEFWRFMIVSGASYKNALKGLEVFDEFFSNRTQPESISIKIGFSNPKIDPQK